MTDKTEVQIKAEMDAVKAMHNAKSNMNKALNRIKTLEDNLGYLINTARKMKDYVPKQAYMYGGNESLHKIIDDAIADAQKVLQ